MALGKIEVGALFGLVVFLFITGALSEVAEVLLDTWDSLTTTFPFLGEYVATVVRRPLVFIIGLVFFVSLIYVIFNSESTGGR